MNDLKPFKHGDEGAGSTHSACDEMVKKLGDEVVCCECSGHSCKPMQKSPNLPKSMQQELDWEKEFDKEFNQYTMIDKTKSFISSLLSKQREEVIGEIKKKVEIMRLEPFDSKDEEDAYKLALKGFKTVLSQLYKHNKNE